MFALLILTPIILAIGVGFIFALAKKENKRKNEKLNRNDFVIRSSYSWGAIMATLEALALCLIIVGNIDGSFGVGVNIFLGILSVAFAYGTLQIFREKVRVIGKNEIIYTPVIGKAKKYSFDQIDRAEKKRTGIYVYVDGKKAFVLDPAGIGSGLFVELYCEE